MLPRAWRAGQARRAIGCWLLRGLKAWMWIGHRAGAGSARRAVQPRGERRGTDGSMSVTASPSRQRRVRELDLASGSLLPAWTIRGLTAAAAGIPRLSL